MTACISSGFFVEVYMIICKTPHTIYSTSIPYNVVNIDALLKIWLIFEMYAEDTSKKIGPMFRIWF